MSNLNGTDYYKYFFGDERGNTFVEVFLDSNFNPKDDLDATQEAVMTGRYRKDNSFLRNERDIDTITVADNDVHPEFSFLFNNLHLE